VVEGDADLIARLAPPDYRARPEQVILFDVAAWDVNCPQHIPRKIDAADVEAAITHLQKQIDGLRAENAALTARLASTGASS
jgi:predicted pyridoxine 5'-phosphate oxidase superfamily flavin-nucleotide-binding protein